MGNVQTSVREVIPEIGGNFELDKSVLNALPAGARVTEARSYGTAAWTRAARVSVVLADGFSKSYFLKCATEVQGRTMMEGEYNSMREIEKYSPSFVPRPCTWGKFQEAPPDTYFFLMEFSELDTGHVDPSSFCSRLAELHLTSKSPNGKFGFHLTTCHGPNAQDTAWHENWTFYFTRLLEQFFCREVASNGADEEYEKTFEVLKSKVIPMILDPLQTDGRTLKPALIHGDLWEENTGTELTTGEPIVFDAAAHYAHNEFELGMWRRNAVRFSKSFLRQYLRHVPPSEPREQWDDRNRLYSIKYDLAHSIASPGTCQDQRDLILDNMRFLIDKYQQENILTTGGLVEGEIDPRDSANLIDPVELGCKSSPDPKKPSPTMPPYTTFQPLAEKAARNSSRKSEGSEIYSSFSVAEKRMIILLAATAGFFSPFSAFIYFPALETIATSLSVSLELMNITVTMYIVIQGIVPSIFGDLSECLGRRPVYLLVFIIYLVASIGLACQHSYAALLVLRMLQSAGSSGTIALAYGVISDIAAPHERGGYVGLAHVGFNSGPSLGPVIGGALAGRVGWQWVFWFLACLSGLVLLLLAFLLPETARNLVGNGSVKATGFNLSAIQHLRSSKNSAWGDLPAMQRPRLRLPNPFTSFKLMFHRNTAIIMSTNAIFYMKYSCVQASLGSLFQEIYGLTVFQSGLCYLAFGFACAFASWGVGQVSNYDYRQTARHHNLSIDRCKGDEIKNFPIEKARLRTVWLYIFVSAASTLGYGWTLESRSTIAAPLVLQFLIGLSVTGIFNVCNTLIVDLHSSQPAAASASVSMTRCAAAAVGVSVLQISLDAIGPGFTFTIIGCLCFATAPLLWLERQKGWEWRLQDM